jgi:2'-5' RNA ligase
MRLFTAIDIPAEVKDRLRELLDKLRPTAKLSWSKVDNLHITTKFIGEWPEARLDEMKRVLAGVKVREIGVRIHGIGWFPDVRRPRVLFAGITASEELAQLACETEAAVALLGVEKEDRAYTPHLTMARIKTSVPLDALRKVIDSLGAADFGSFHATAFYLYLSAAGKYTKLAEYALN